jgi:hypothetical protein
VDNGVSDALFISDIRYDELTCLFYVYRALQLTLSSVYESFTILANGNLELTVPDNSLPVREYYINHPCHLSKVI